MVIDYSPLSITGYSEGKTEPPSVTFNTMSVFCLLITRSQHLVILTFKKDKINKLRNSRTKCFLSVSKLLVLQEEEKEDGCGEGY